MRSKDSDAVLSLSRVFSAGAYLGPGNELVISFSGTLPGATDLLWRNIPAGLGLPNAQVRQAIEFVSDVMAAAPVGAQIQFTGHSLGGGLASLMRVFFDRPAVTFDMAPFELAAKESFGSCAFRSEY